MPVGCRARACVRSETPCCARGCCRVMSFSPRGCAHPVSGRARLLRVCWPPSAPLVRGPAVRTVGTIRTAPGPPFQVCNVRFDSKLCVAPPAARRRPWPVSRTRRRRRGIDRSVGHGRAGPRVRGGIKKITINFKIQISAPSPDVPLGDIRRKPDSRLTSRRRARRRGSQQRVWAVSRPRRRTVPRTGRGS